MLPTLSNVCIIMTDLIIKGIFHETPFTLKYLEQTLANI